jgi:RNA polymerase sigma factor (TIGR02999 family)
MADDDRPLPLRADALSTRLHDELRQLAAARLRHVRPGQTVDATALVHEAWLKLRADGTFADQRAFFGAAARAMKDILVERVRARLAHKRGGGALPAELDTGIEALRPAVGIDDLLSLDQALLELQHEHPDEADLTMRRFFSGQTNAEIARDLDVSERTIERRWRFARAWLARRLGAEPSVGDTP